MRFSTQPSGPFSLAAAREHFGGWISTAGAPDSVLMAFPVEGWQGSAAVVVHQENETVEGEVYGDDALAEQAWAQALAVLSLDFDGSGFPPVGERDPVIGRLQHEYQMVRPVCFHSPYEAACSFVIGHRMSIAQARTVRAKLAQAHGAAIRVGSETVHAFPKPQVLLELEG